MDKKEDIKWIIIGLIAGIIAALLNFVMFSNQDLQLWRSVISGIVTLFFVQLLRIIYKISEIKSNQNKILTSINPDKFTWNYMKLILEHGEHKIDKDALPLVWAELILNTRNLYRATNYIKKENIYRQQWAKSRLLLQQARIECDNVEIQKVFIFWDEAEYKDSIDDIKEQKKSKIHLKYITLNQIVNDVTIKNHSKIISLDFGVFDDKLVLAWELDEKRDFKNGYLIFEESQVKEYLNYFRKLYSASQEYIE